MGHRFQYRYDNCNNEGSQRAYRLPIGSQLIPGQFRMATGMTGFMNAILKDKWEEREGTREEAATEFR